MEWGERAISHTQVAIPLPPFAVMQLRVSVVNYVPGERDLIDHFFTNMWIDTEEQPVLVSSNCVRKYIEHGMPHSG